MKKILKKIIPSKALSFYYLLYPLLGVLWYRFPSKKLIVIGITGTNGKTTVAHFTADILKEAGFAVATMSSVYFEIKGKQKKNMLKMTMPGRLKLQKFLRQAVNSGCQYAVLEVTSEGIKQFRHKFIDFDIAVLTNVTKEHIEAHGSFENYRAAKGKLFQVCKNIHIINADDKNAEYFLQFPAAQKIVYQLKDKSSLLCSNELLGEFNVYNALAAIKTGLSQGIDLVTCQKAIKKIEGVPGRMEQVISSPFQVFIDYAHTPDALQKVYATLSVNPKSQIPKWASPSGFSLNSKQYQNPKLICVLGSCGGGRDKWKRKELGEIAAQHCDQIILTNEDPYSENPQEIINQIEHGIKNISVDQRSHQRKSAVFKILDRREAIRRALNLAKEGDVVIITGKGSEPWMCIANGRKIPWDDRQVVKEEFQSLKENQKNF